MKLFYAMLLFCNLFFLDCFSSSEINWRKKLQHFFPEDLKYAYGLHALTMYQRVHASSDWIGVQDSDHIGSYIKELEYFLQSTNGFFRAMVKNPMLTIKDFENRKDLKISEKDFKDCFFKPVYQLPNKKILEKVFASNGYDQAPAIQLATGYYNSDQLLFALLLFKQNEPFNTCIPGQQTTLRLVNEIIKESCPCSYIFSSKETIDPIILTYIASTGLEYTEDELELLDQKISSFCLKKVTVDELESIFKPYDSISGNQLHSSVVIGALLQQSRVIYEE